MSEKQPLPPPKTLWDACVRKLEEPPKLDGTESDPLAKVRLTLGLFSQIIALKFKEDPRKWSVYVENHRHAGVRFVMRNAAGREVDLQKIPGTFEGLADWKPSS